MEECLALLSDGTTWTRIRSDNTDFKKMASEYKKLQCPGCNAPVYISNANILYSPQHRPGCRIALAADAKREYYSVQTTYDFRSIVTGVDKPANWDWPPPPRDPNNHPPIPDPIILDKIVYFSNEIITNMTCLRKKLESMGPYDYIGDYPVNDIVYNEKHLIICQKGTLNGLLIVPLVRASPTQVGENFKSPAGYTLFRLFSSHKSDVFFLIKIKNEENNVKFRDRVMGNPNKGIPKDKLLYINACGNWRRYETPFESVIYFSDLNIRGIDFSYTPVRYRND